MLALEQWEERRSFQKMKTCSGRTRDPPDLDHDFTLVSQLSRGRGIICQSTSSDAYTRLIKMIHFLCMLMKRTYFILATLSINCSLWSSTFITTSWTGPPPWVPRRRCPPCSRQCHHLHWEWRNQSNGRKPKVRWLKDLNPFTRVGAGDICLSKLNMWKMRDDSG